MPRHLLIHKIKLAFHLVSREPWYHRIWRYPFPIRVIFATLLIIYGIVAALTPLPLGVLMIILGTSLLIGPRRARICTIRIVHFLRLHILFWKLYTRWHHWKNTR